MSKKSAKGRVPSAEGKAKKALPAGRASVGSAAVDPRAPLAGEVLVLRVCDKNRKGYGGFQWPASGEVSAPDWRAQKACGNGLHGWLWGRGDGNCSDAIKLPGALWMVVAVVESTVIELDGKVKYPRGRVVFCGDRVEAAAIVARFAPPSPSCGGIIGAQVSSGYSGQSTSGDSGQSTSGDSGQSTSGYSGQSTSGDRGQSTSGYRGQSTSGYRGQSTSGYSGQSTSGDSGQSTSGYSGQSTSGYRGQSTSGYRGQSTSGDRGQSTSGYRGQSTSGDRGQSTSGYSGQSTSGDRGMVKAGDQGALLLPWWDEKKQMRRWAFGEVGQNGIKKDTWYWVVDGALAEVPAADVKARTEEIEKWRKG